MALPKRAVLTRWAAGLLATGCALLLLAARPSSPDAVRASDDANAEAGLAWCSA
ncbi:hypothetical protein T492DRAFT_876958, partial [Pavlovales sp. CCMP2436]